MPAFDITSFFSITSWVRSVVWACTGSRICDIIRLMSLPEPVSKALQRRAFLRFLAASPLAARAWAADESNLPATAKDVLNVMDFEPIAKKALPPAHWGY